MIYGYIYSNLVYGVTIKDLGWVLDYIYQARSIYCDIHEMNEDYRQIGTFTRKQGVWKECFDTDVDVTDLAKLCGRYFDLNKFKEELWYRTQQKVDYDLKFMEQRIEELK